MKSPRRIAIPLLALLAASPCRGQQRFPPPEFGSGYRLPPTATPATSPPWREYADLGVMLAALVAASVLAHRVRRRWPIVLLGLASLAYFGFIRGGCICPIGAIQNVAEALLGGGPALPLAAVGFFILPLAFALLVGRTFCAAVCPLGAAQDVVVLKPIRVPTWLEHALGLLAYLYLGAAVIFAATGSAYIICQYDPFVSIFRLIPVGKIIEGRMRLVEQPDVRALTGMLIGRIDTLLLAGGFLAVGVFIARPYCRFLCPYGVLLGLLSRLSLWRVTITPGECVRCRLCEGACPFGSIRRPSARAHALDRGRGKPALAACMLALPVLVVLGGWLGGLAGSTMARVHPTVRLADRIRLEDSGAVEGTTDASDAFRAKGRPAEELYAQADSIEAEFNSRWRLGRLPAFGWAHLLGVVVSLAAGLKLVGSAIRRTRTDYEADRTACLACGRCFASCPVEQARRKGTPVQIVQRTE